MHEKNINYSFLVIMSYITYLFSNCSDFLGVTIACSILSPLLIPKIPIQISILYIWLFESKIKDEFIVYYFCKLTFDYAS